MVHVAVVFFFWLFCQCFVTFWGLWQKTELPTWTWSQGHVNTDICFKPRVDTLLSLPLIFAFHAHVTLFILQPIWPCLHEGHVQFTTKRRNVFGLNLQEGILRQCCIPFIQVFDLPFAISSREKKTLFGSARGRRARRSEFINTYHLEKLLPAAQIEKLHPKLKGFVRIAENFLWGCCDHASKKRERIHNSNKIEIGNVARQH